MTPMLAYLDAGMGSLIFQVVAAGLVSAAVVFGGLIAQLRVFVSRVILRRPPAPVETDEPASATDADPASQRKAA